MNRQVSPEYVKQAASRRDVLKLAETFGGELGRVHKDIDKHLSAAQDELTKSIGDEKQERQTAIKAVHDMFAEAKTAIAKRFEAFDQRLKEVAIKAASREDTLWQSATVAQIQESRNVLNAYCDTFLHKKSVLLVGDEDDLPAIVRVAL